MSGAVPTPRSPLPALYGLGFVAFVAMTLPMFCMPYVAKDFGLGDEGITFLMGVISVGSLGTFALTRLADRRGRRRTMLLSFAGLSPLSLATALSPGAAFFAAAQMGALALHSTLRMVTTVAITELADEGRRARAQAWLGFVSGMGGAVPMIVVASLGDRPGGWRYGFGALAAALLAWPWVRARAPETGRFDRAQALGVTDKARAGDLFRGAYRRRATGLLLAAMLRGAGLIGLGHWTFYHGVHGLGLSGWVVTAIFMVGGTPGMLGLPAGALLAERWGRRPTFLLGLALELSGGIAFYLLTPTSQTQAILQLGAAFFVYNFGSQCHSVADRLVDTELFPTALRATYAGMRTIAEAVAAIASHFTLSALIVGVGALPHAITFLSLATVLPSAGLFLWAASETRGLSLEAASLEAPPPSPPEAR